MIFQHGDGLIIEEDLEVHKMRYIQRNQDGKLIGHFANENELATEFVEDDNIEIVEFNRIKNETRQTTSQRITELENRIHKLEMEIKNAK